MQHGAQLRREGVGARWTPLAPRSPGNEDCGEGGARRPARQCRCSHWGRRSPPGPSRRLGNGVLEALPPGVGGTSPQRQMEERGLCREGWWVSGEARPLGPWETGGTVARGVKTTGHRVPRKATRREKKTHGHTHEDNSIHSSPRGRRPARPSAGGGGTGRGPATWGGVAQPGKGVGDSSRCRVERKQPPLCHPGRLPPCGLSRTDESVDAGGGPVVP